MKRMIKQATNAATATFMVGLLIQGSAAVLRRPWSRAIKIETGMKTRIKRALNEDPTYILTGQMSGPAISSNSRLRNQKDIPLVIDIGMSVPP